jgi:uncharacterized peroxidase-related enzyme
VFIDPVSSESAEGLTAQIYEDTESDLGFVPDYVKVFSHHPEAFNAWERLVTDLYEGMDRRRCELATFAAARAMKSTACAIAHGRTLRSRFFTADEVIQIVNDHHHAGLDQSDVAVMDFAEKAANDPTAIAQTDVDDLRALGLSDRDIFDVAYAVAARAFLTTLIESLGVQAVPAWVEDLEPELVDLLSVGRPAR